MKQTYLIFTLLISAFTFAQTELPPAPSPIGTATGLAPEWPTSFARASGDSCGAYFNQYIGLKKTSLVFFEPVLTGDATNFAPYNGRGQRFHANQEIEVGGVQFYSFHTSEIFDSLMVVTLLYDYEAATDSVGAELARDTVWVSHTAITPFLPAIAVDSYFDEPITVTDDYIVGLYTPSNDSLKIITNSASGDGAGEGVSFLYYDNPAAPSFTGWYPTLPSFGPAYDIDYLINPLVKFDLHDDFTLDNDTLCPIAVEACADYMQFPIFADPHYNNFSDTSQAKINWNWGDGTTHTDTLNICHTYDNSGSYTLTLTDTLSRHNFEDVTCTFEVLKTIFVEDSAMAGGAFLVEASTVTFESIGTVADSILWVFGDGSENSIENSPMHTYTGLDTYEAWLYAYGPCNTDSINFSVTTNDVGLTEKELLNVEVFPNPANESVFIKGITAGTSIEISNIVGDIVFQKTAILNTAIETNNFAPGTYFIRLTNKDGQAIKKLIIKH